MATIELGNGRYIAGDTDPTLHAGNHWCEFCDGDGLDYYTGLDGEYELTICGGCSGVGQVECVDGSCTEHSRR